MTDHLQTFLETKLDELRDQWSPEDLELAKKIAKDVADLTLRAVAGDPTIEHELELARAAAEAVAAAGEVTLGKFLRDSVVEFVTEVADRLV